MDLISVVLVTYNSSETIVETLDSVKNQTYPLLELIICDDHSKDNTVRIIKKWLKKNYYCFKKVRLLVGKKNHGVTKNCNIGIQQAKGKYIQELAGDDILRADAIEKKYIYAETNHLDVVYCKVEVFGSHMGEKLDMQRYCNRGYTIIEQGWEEQNKNIVIDNFLAGPSGGFYNRKYFLSIGGYDIRFPMLEDYPFIYKYITAGNEISLINEELVRYRVSGKSLCTARNKRFDISSMKFYMIVRLPELIKRRKFKVAWSQFLYYMNVILLK